MKRLIVVGLLVLAGCGGTTKASSPPKSRTTPLASTTTSTTTTTLDPTAVARAAYFGITAEYNAAVDQIGAKYSDSKQTINIPWRVYPKYCADLAPVAQQWLTGIQGVAWPAAAQAAATKLIADQAAEIGYLYDCAAAKTAADAEVAGTKINTDGEEADSSALRAVMGLPIYRG